MNYFSKKLVFFLPLAIFLIIAFYFFWQLEYGRNPALIPSVMVNKPAPKQVLPPLLPISQKGLDENSLIGIKAGSSSGIKVVNFFASWCVPCKAEHPFITSLSKDKDIEIIGIAYKDKPEDSIGFLESLGNPFSFVAVDQDGHAAIDWGLYGVPETYLIDQNGIIRYKYTGPLVGDIAQNELLDQIESLKSDGK